MSKLKELQKRLKWLKVLLIVIPFTYALVVKLLKSCVKKPKRLIVVVVTIVALLSYLLVIGGFFKTKQEIHQLQSIQLIIEPAR